MKTRSWAASLAAAAVLGGCGGSSSDVSDPDSGAGGSSSGSGGAGASIGGQTGAGTAGAGGVGGGAGGSPAMPTTGDPCVDCTPAGGGVTIGCEKRFFYGVNYAWASFGNDFGSTRNGVAAQRAARLAALNDMRANGVDVVRWWVFPNLNAAGVVFDAAGSPTGLGGSAIADIAAALDIAAQASVHLQPTLFSFDNFRIMNGNAVNARNLAPIISDPARRVALMDHVVIEFANQVGRSANADRVISWDVINEPEWAISGDDGPDPAFTPQTTVTTVSYDVMKTFVTDVVTALRGVSDMPITVGAAAIKWSKAWAGIGDFYTFHMYDWVNQSFPYTRSLAAYGVTDKPVVLGEFPVQGLTGVPYATLVGALYDLGYAGAMAWSVTDASFPWAPNKGNVKAFADQKGCVTRY